jgi:hypothetical protein
VLKKLFGMLICSLYWKYGEKYDESILITNVDNRHKTIGLLCSANFQAGDRIIIKR